MQTFQDQLVLFAGKKADEILRLADTTGSIEGWLRAEAALAALDGYFGALGASDRVFAEGGRTDLALHRAGKKTAVEFKFAFNNKNLIGGYNGTGGIEKDLKKLSQQKSFDEKYVAVFFAFYSRHVHGQELNKFYGQHAKGIALQPSSEHDDFDLFCAGLANQVVGSLSFVGKPSGVHAIKAESGSWLGLWCHQVA